jgi:hypothetical protein
MVSGKLYVLSEVSHSLIASTSYTVHVRSIHWHFRRQIGADVKVPGRLWHCSPTSTLILQKGDEKGKLSQPKHKSGKLGLDLRVNSQRW